MGAGKVVFHFTNTPERREEGKLEEVELVFETGDDRRNGLPLVPGTDCIMILQYLQIRSNWPK